MSRWAAPKATYRRAKHAGCLITRWDVPKANTAVRSTEVAR